MVRLVAWRTFAAEDVSAVDFVDLAWQLHRDDPHWIPPLQMQQLDELTGASPYLGHRALRMFLCEDRDRLVGRVAALVDDRVPGVGQLGYFESIDDDRVAGSLFRTAGAWLREQGAPQMMGPINGGMHRAHRLMTHGFEAEAFLNEPRNPDYYPRLFEAHGFVPVRHWHGYDLDRAGIAALADRLHRLLDRSGHDHGGLTVQPVANDDLAQLGGRLYELLKAAECEELTHAGPGPGEWREAFGPVLSMLGPHGLLTLSSAGEVQALVFQYPDYGREVHGLGGDDAAWGRWNRFPQSQRIVIHTATAMPRAHEDTALIVLEHAARTALADGYERMVFAPMPGEPRFFRGIAAPDREYALYGRPL